MMPPPLLPPHFECLDPLLDGYSLLNDPSSDIMDQIMVNIPCRKYIFLDERFRQTENGLFSERPTSHDILWFILCLSSSSSNDANSSILLYENTQLRESLHWCVVEKHVVVTLIISSDGC